MAGRLYGGSSRLKADASPASTVPDSSRDTTSVVMTPITTIPTTAAAAAIDAKSGDIDAPTKIVASMISVG